jgi:hypothetical protein
VNPDAEIFNKLTESERDRLLRDLADVHGDILCKGDGEDLYRLKVERIGNNKELYCLAASPTAIPESETDLLGNFSLGGERYFFRSPAIIHQEFVTLRADGEVFHLQRRQNYRLKIPANYRALFTIMSHQGKPMKVNADILDLSTGGCKAELKTAGLVLLEGDEIEGMLLIAGREAIGIKGVIRHRKAEATNLGSRQTFGVEFSGVSAPLEAKLFAITMDLHRQFFTRLNNKS